jgi:hypothetical protein
MKPIFFILMLLVVAIPACAPTQKITGLWSDHEAIPKEPFKSVFIMVLMANKNNNYKIESQMAKVVRSRGLKAVKSNDIFPPVFSPTTDITREQLAEAIKKAGCDVVFIIALLDTKIEQHYTAGSSYSPMTYGFNGTYYGYYNYYYPQLYSPGYYTTSKTYYIQSNLYDLASEKLIWSVQSEAHNPKNLDSGFKDYSELLINKLEQEGLIKK